MSIKTAATWSALEDVTWNAIWVGYFVSVHPLTYVVHRDQNHTVTMEPS